MPISNTLWVTLWIQTSACNLKATLYIFSGFMCGSTCILTKPFETTSRICLFVPRGGTLLLHKWVNRDQWLVLWCNFTFLSCLYNVALLCSTASRTTVSRHAGVRSLRVILIFSKTVKRINAKFVGKELLHHFHRPFFFQTSNSLIFHDFLPVFVKVEPY